LESIQGLYAAYKERLGVTAVVKKEAGPRKKFMEPQAPFGKDGRLKKHISADQKNGGRTRKKFVELQHPFGKG